MTDTPEPTIDSYPWHPVPAPCPRCNQPLKARATPTVSKILELLCTKCGHRQDVEAIRSALKAVSRTAPDPDTPNELPQTS